MISLASMLAALTILSLVAWLYLIFYRAGFWRVGPMLGPPVELAEWPPVAVIVPARDEAAVIEGPLRSLRNLDYPGKLRIVLIDDGSSDGTGAVASKIAGGGGHPLEIIAGKPPGEDWSGKVWAMAQGVEHARRFLHGTRFFWFTDADVEHDPQVLRGLVWRAVSEDLDLVSTMVCLHSTRLWERLLIPAFVFYFRLLYPFRLVNTPGSRVAAAAGGSMLVRTDALQSAGGFPAIRGELIDDCALARLLKQKSGRIWLGLTLHSRSIRRYRFADIWRMVARSAYTQLNRRAWMLAATVAAMTVAYLVPVLGLAYGFFSGRPLPAIVGATAWVLMAVAYCPMIRFYCQPTAASLFLPLASLLYTLMTVDSALRHWRGEGVLWKGRTHAGDRRC